MTTKIVTCPTCGQESEVIIVELKKPEQTIVFEALMEYAAKHEICVDGLLFKVAV